MHSDADRYYTPKEMSEMLSIEPVTLRKYSIALEKAGYIFIRNDSDHRLYTERDVISLQHLKALRERNALNVDNAAMAVTTRFFQVNGPSETVTHGENLPVLADTERYEALESKVDAQAEQIAQLIELNQRLIERLDERDAHINELVNVVTAQRELAAARGEEESERDRKLTEVLRMLQEAKEERSKSFIARLFGK